MNDKKQFYSEIIEIDSVFVAIDSLNASKEEKEHLKGMMATTIHHAVLDTTMSQLSKVDKKTFLENLLSEDHEKIWKLLDEKVKDAKTMIKHTGKELVEEFHKDIRSLKGKKS